MVVLDDKDDLKSGLLIVEERRSVQAAADFEADFQAAGKILKEMVADPEGQGKNEAPKTRDLGFVGDGYQSDALLDVMKGMQKNLLRFLLPSQQKMLLVRKIFWR